MSHEHDPHHGQRRTLRVVTVTISDTRTEATDLGGRVLRDLLTQAGCVVLRHVIVTDDPERVRAEITRVITDDKPDAVVSTGGTGISPRDQTYEALAAMCDKTLDGFGEAFRRLSWDEIGPMAILSRAMAGVHNGTVLIALPGAPGAIRTGVEGLIAPTLEHMVALVKK